MPFNDLHFDIDKYLNPFVPRSRLHRLPRPISHFLGYRDAPRKPLGNIPIALWSFFGAFCGTSVLAGLFMANFIKDKSAPIIIGSYGAAAILEYNVIDSPLSQPRNAIGGQLLSALIGVSITKLFALSSDFESLRWLAGALAVATASAAMTLTKTIHPPAGATALLAAVTPDISALGWFYLLIVFLSTLLTLTVSCIVNNVQRQFPIYWWTPRVAPAPAPAPKDEEKASAEPPRLPPLRFPPVAAVHTGDDLVVTAAGVLVPALLYLSNDEWAVLKVLEERLRGARDATLEDSSSGSESLDSESLKSLKSDDAKDVKV